MSTERGSWTSLVTQLVKNPPAMRETWVRSLGWKSPLEKGMATHSSILAWRIPWTEEPGGRGLQSMGSHRIRHNWVIKRTQHTHTQTQEAPTGKNSGMIWTSAKMVSAMGWNTMNCFTHTHTHTHTHTPSQKPFSGQHWRVPTHFENWLIKRKNQAFILFFSILKVAQLCPTRYRYKGIVFL